VPPGIIKSNKKIKYTKSHASRTRYTVDKKIRRHTTKVRQG